MPAEFGKRSPKGADKTPKDASPTPPPDIEAEYTRIQEGVLAAIAAKENSVDPSALNKSDTYESSSYRALVAGHAIPEMIQSISHTHVNSEANFAIAFQRVARAIAPIGNGITEITKEQRTTYGLGPLPVVKTTRHRFDVPTAAEIKVKEELRRSVMQSIAASLAALPHVSHDLSKLLKDNGFVIVKSLYPDDEAEQHAFLREALFTVIQEIYQPNALRTVRERQLVQSHALDKVLAAVGKHFSDEEREKERQAYDHLRKKNKV